MNQQQYAHLCRHHGLLAKLSHLGAAARASNEGRGCSEDPNASRVQLRSLHGHAFFAVEGGGTHAPRKAVCHSRA